MYDELIKWLRVFCEGCKLWDGYKCCFKGECSQQKSLQAADAIEKLQLYVDLYKDLAEKAEKVAREVIDKYPKWISVTKGLPKIDEKHHCSKDVLAYLKDGGMCFTALEENIFGQTWFECERNPSFEEEMIVTHWMNLPKPPKEENDV